MDNSPNPPKAAQQGAGAGGTDLHLLVVHHALHAALHAESGAFDDGRERGV